jgi:hypothetical protein
MSTLQRLGCAIALLLTGCGVTSSYSGMIGGGGTGGSVGPATYYMSPTGSDSNPGTSALPWISPNHPINCGDTILAAPSALYNESHFVATSWGTVSCPGNNNVAWVKCEMFDACKITTATDSSGMRIGASYWGVQGFEVTALINDFSGCFQIQPPPGSAATIHHIIFANDICNGANNGGFSSYNNPQGASADYIVFVGNIAYNSANAANVCASGFSIDQPVKSDSSAGTHLYLSGNFSWANSNPITCNGGPPTDGDGLILDTFDGTPSQGVILPYDQQTVVTNNLLIGNGGRGFEIFKNNGGPSGAANAHIFVYQNTSWGNSTDIHQIFPPCGEFQLSGTHNTELSRNIGVTTASDCLGGMSDVYAFLIQFDDSSNSVHDNVGFSPIGLNFIISNNEGFSIGSNPLFGTDPQFANPSVPPSPNCGAATSAPNCMATVIANFAPTNSAAAAYGYQIPPAGNVTDPLFPAWLCNVNLPAGLVAKSCAQ